MRKRLIYRCDDVGYTKTYDEGIFNVLDSGIGCSADVMFDAGHVREALEFLRERPWISVGWHRHLWEGPVLDPKEVPSMVDEEGRFKWRHRHAERMNEVTYDDAYREFRAEMELCHSILGRYPDVCSLRGDGNELERAYQKVVEECAIPHNYFSRQKPREEHPQGSEEFRKMDSGRRGPAPRSIVDEKWKDRHIISANAVDSKGFDLQFVKDYNPLKALTALKWTEDEEIYFYGCHPGFVDDHIYAESTCSIHRIIEYRDAMSEEYRKWIIENKVELINFRDALYGTNDFQDHLKEINSPLWIGNM
ncbi:MAG: ChbG/HpnK family deacetylase [Erysipelotrichaceae bacterium]|nr:ChbG/HpnK family deacetylase [Erysipelotrichaceae bacterium]